MTPPDGRVLQNLDEFMLRLGHVTVACRAAVDVGGSTYRTVEELSDRLTASTSVSAGQVGRVAAYLKAKGLAPTVTQANDSVSYRYPDIQIDDRGTEWSLIALGGSEPEIWWQDLMLSDEQVRSRVGGVTVRAKSGSKSGLSHILDWAQLLDLISATADIAPDGRLIANVASSANPYVLGLERIVYAWHYLQADFDLAARLIRRIADTDGVIKRKQATEIFVLCLEDLQREADETKGLTNRQYDSIYNVLSELRRSAEKASKEVSETSTAWHRASSRYETLVDLGLFAKASGDGEYSYQYKRTSLLPDVAESFESAGSADDWFDHHFVRSVFPDFEEIDVQISDELLRDALDLLGSGSALISIDSLVLALSVCLGRQGRSASVASWRDGLKRLTQERPEIARLAAGRYGPRAEFISIRRRKLGEQ